MGIAFVCLKSKSFAKMIREEPKICGKCKNPFGRKWLVDSTPKLELNPFEKQKYMFNGISVEKAFIEQDIEWKYLNNNSFHLLIQKIIVVAIVLVVSILLVTPVSVYVVV